MRGAESAPPAEVPFGGTPPGSQSLTAAAGWGEALRWMVVGAGVVLSLVLLAAAVLIASRSGTRRLRGRRRGPVADSRTT